MVIGPTPPGTGVIDPATCTDVVDEWLTWGLIPQSMVFYTP